MKHTIALLITILLLSSCYEQTIDLKRGLNGTINYKLNISNDFKNFINTLNSEFSSLSLHTEPIADAEKLTALLSELEEVTLVDRRNVKEGENELQELTLAFRKMSDLQTLQAALPTSYFKNSIYKEKNSININTTLTLDFLGPQNQIIAAYKELSSEERSYIDAFASLITLKFRYQCYNEIMKVEGIKAELSSDKKEASFSYTLFDLLNSNKPLEIMVTMKP